MEDIKYLVIGDPVKHSLSPVMQNAAFDFFDEGKPYSFRELSLEELPAFAEYAKANLSGFNITAPYKQEIMKYCSVIHEEAEAANSVNTVKVIAGKLYGYTTDGYGLLEALRTILQYEPAGGTVLILGAGGAASSVALTLVQDGLKKLIVANRSLARAEELVAPHGGQAIELSDLAAMDIALEEADVVIQCTSLGLRPDDESPLSEAQLRKVKMLFDTVYLPTKLQADAKKLGIKVVNGSTMLLYQGARAFEIWTGHAAPIIKMQLALEKAIKE